MSVFRPAIDRMAGYAPGEQPQDTGWVKLNTNENPYPPSPRVIDAIRRTAEGRLNIYPDPHATAFRRTAAAQQPSSRRLQVSLSSHTQQKKI